MASPATLLRPHPVPSPEASEFQETRSVQLEWKVSNLRQLFDQSKGDAKSKCVKSALFDQSRWQIFLYPNSGNDQYLSVYLSCEPTAAEKERAMAEQPSVSGNESTSMAQSGKEKERIPWRRDGKFLFTFEVRSIDRRVTFKQLESEKPHTFWYRERNWGYASFWRRNEAFYNNPTTRAADAFLIICTIVSSPTLPTSPPLPHLLVPKTLIHAYASLFDDPDYSDVVFRIRPDRTAGRLKRTKEKRLYAAKKVLAGRSEYFDMMFSSAFSEATLSRPTASRRTARATPTATTMAARALDSEASDADELDDDDEDDGCDEDDDSGVDESEEEEEEEAEVDEASRNVRSRSSFTSPPRADQRAIPAAADQMGPAPMDIGPTSARVEPRRSRTSSMDEASDEERPASATLSSPTAVRPGAAADDNEEDEDMDDGEDGGAAEGQERPSTPRGVASRFVDAPTSAPASPAGPARVERSEIQRPTKGRSTRVRKGDDRPRFEVVVTDAAYSTFRALLNFLYTDAISFSPLASTYYVAKDHAASQGLPFPYASRRAFLVAQAPALAVDAPGALGTGVKSAAVGPASAKAIYRLADKMGLAELKERAYDHIVSSLTVQNIVYEVFGSFSSRFEEIRRVEVAFLLDKWNEVRAGPQMRKVFEYLRSPSRFPGFEDVWLEVVQNLEVRVPPPAALSTGSGAAGAEVGVHGAGPVGRTGEEGTAA